MIVALALAVAAAVLPAPANPAATPPAAPRAATVKSKDAAPSVVTPVADRVVRFAALNKRNGQTEEFSLKPGGTAHFATLTITVRSCETTPPWDQRMTAAYLQIDDAPVRVRTAAVSPPQRIYSGWMYAESPSLNPLQHPLYDVWVRSCTMSFPETGPGTLVVGRTSPSAVPAPSPSSAAKSPVPAKAPSN